VSRLGNERVEIPVVAILLPVNRQVALPPFGYPIKSNRKFVHHFVKIEYLATLLVRDILYPFSGRGTR